MQHKRKKPDGRCVYFIEAGEHLKIGVAKNPHKRIRDLQVANPEPLRLVAVMSPSEHDAVTMERHIHFVLSQYRVGGEWFKVPARDAMEKLGQWASDIEFVNAEYLERRGQKEMKRKPVPKYAWKDQPKRPITDAETARIEQDRIAAIAYNKHLSELWGPLLEKYPPQPIKLNRRNMANPPPRKSRPPKP